MVSISYIILGVSGMKREIELLKIQLNKGKVFTDYSRPCMLRISLSLLGLITFTIIKLIVFLNTLPWTLFSNLEIFQRQLLINL